MIWQARLSFRSADGNTGLADWVIEAFDVAQVHLLVEAALVRSGRVAAIVDIQAGAQVQSAAVGLATVLNEGPIRWEGQVDQSVITLAAMPDHVTTALPDWLPAPLWQALYTQQDDARVYAVIDPSLWPTMGADLASDLAQSGLPAAPLYLATTDEAVAATSPWLVDLTLPPGPMPDMAPSTIHQRLGTTFLLRPAGIFIRAPIGLSAMRAGLRKLTKVQDQDGKWYYNRFWEPEFFLYFISFLAGRRLLAPIAQVTGIAAVAGEGLIAADCDLSGCATAPLDRDGDLDLLFDAGTAMVALRHARACEAKHNRAIEPDAAYALARAELMRDGMDYATVCQCVDIAYALISFYGDSARQALQGRLQQMLFSDDGQESLHFPFFHGHVMFGLSQNIPPHHLRNTYWS
jgi:hypothetical protein